MEPYWGPAIMNQRPFVRLRTNLVPKKFSEEQRASNVYVRASHHEENITTSYGLQKERLALPVADTNRITALEVHPSLPALLVGSGEGRLRLLTARLDSPTDRDAQAST